MIAAMHAEAIYKGATRPAMKFGVPLVPLVSMFAVAALLVMWIGPLFSWWILPIVVLALAPAFTWMRFTTRRDDQRLHQMFIAAKLLLVDRNRRFWRSRSYAPYLHQGTRDVWHR